SSFGTWLTRIMLNGCYAQKQKNRHILAQFGSPEDLIQMSTPANELANKELGRLLEDAIARLPEKYRLVFVMREIEEMSVRQTSEALDIGEPNVKVRLNRAKTMLRESLGGYMKDHVYCFHLSRCDNIVAHVLHQLGIV
ncbi:MAG: sigma-70 family RNA polymerase sigma factor, partial [Chitinophagaceae bacterium]|nr:sigma-70 family RNA polymerase sigma factor [Chitinophagaceae bacterium]